MTQLVKYDAMCSAIDAAYRVDEVKDIRDKAIALETYCRQAKNVEAERQACEIRLRAERKAGDLRRKEEKQKGRPKSSPAAGEVLTNAERRKQLGISKKQDDQWQALAAIPQREFDLALKEAERPTTNGIIRATSEPKATPVASDALWLWGRLRDFERDGLLEKDPASILRTMTSEMKDDVHRLAPRVAAWLKRIGALE